ncbi:MAG: hypothetical protein OEW64_03720 [Gammaproteobacteria bacterium]|nr:hypothetical protein [Gammaproteobacteria bacterium]MDH5303186.1 hypothetical protein [Gammaproteobacteria bacterium]MDH5320806.1 hypothetical protein [Gammaproteobacteria bacterium]
MNMWVAIVCIVAIVIGADTINKISRNKKQTKGDVDELGATLRHVEALEERIRVLERIVTENKFDLRSEINRL